jgi:hypothetical protein
MLFDEETLIGVHLYFCIADTNLSLQGSNEKTIDLLHKILPLFFSQIAFGFQFFGITILFKHFFEVPDS